MELTTAHNNNNDMNSSDYENSYVPPCVLVPDKELNGLTNSHVELNTLDDMQECLSNSHHKKTFGDNEDTLSYWKSQLLPHWKFSLMTPVPSRMHP
jgi:hypothetical protein